jgi:hypothetical protein
MYEGTYKSNDNCWVQQDTPEHAPKVITLTILFGKFLTSHQRPAVSQLYTEYVIMLVPLSN